MTVTPPPNTTEPISSARFHSLLDTYLISGLRADGSSAVTGTQWSSISLAHLLQVTPASVNNWRNGRNFPQSDNLRDVLKILFGADYHNSHEARSLVALYNKQSPFFLFIKDADDLDVEEKATQQVPAAFRFGVVNAKIDALPSNPEIIDLVAAKDLFEELREKTNALSQRIKGSNVDEHAQFGVQRLCQALSTPLAAIRPGVLLSRLRTLESIREAYDGPEGRELTFPDFRALVGDVCLTAQDLLATFPEVRRIERERLALGLESSPDDMKKIQEEMLAVQRAAVENGVVAAGAIKALSENDLEMAQSISVEERANLIGDNLLIVRNFASEAIRSVATSSKHGVLGVWDLVKPDLEIGTKQAVRILPTLLVVGLITSIAGPIAGIAAILKGDVFRPVSNAASKVRESQRGRG